VPWDFLSGKVDVTMPLKTNSGQSSGQKQEKD